MRTRIKGWNGLVVSVMGGCVVAEWPLPPPTDCSAVHICLAPRAIATTVAIVATAVNTEGVLQRRVALDAFGAAPSLRLNNVVCSSTWADMITVFLEKPTRRTVKCERYVDTYAVPSGELEQLGRSGSCSKNILLGVFVFMGTPQCLYPFVVSTAIGGLEPRRDARDTAAIPTPIRSLL
mgnify:CR=1 FL=1